jgi:type II secretory pathway component PulL
MGAAIKVFVTLVIFICLVAIPYGLFGLFHRHFTLHGTWRDDASEWGLRLAIVAVALSLISLVLTLYVTWQTSNQIHKVDSRLEAVLRRIQSQTGAFENFETQVSALSAMSRSNHEALLKIEESHKLLIDAVKATKK